MSGIDQKTKEHILSSILAIQSDAGLSPENQSRAKFVHSKVTAWLDSGLAWYFAEVRKYAREITQAKYENERLQGELAEQEAYRASVKKQEQRRIDEGAELFMEVNALRKQVEALKEEPEYLRSDLADLRLTNLELRQTILSLERKANHLRNLRETLRSLIAGDEPEAEPEEPESPPESPPADASPPPITEPEEAPEPVQPSPAPPSAEGKPLPAWRAMAARIVDYLENYEGVYGREELRRNLNITPDQENSFTNALKLGVKAGMFIQERIEGRQLFYAQANHKPSTEKG